MKQFNLIHFSIVVFVSFFVISMVDIIHDFEEIGQINSHIMVEGIMGIISLFALIVLLVSIRKQYAKLNTTTFKLAKAEKELGDTQSQMSKFMGEFSSLIQKQFDDWALTQSEKEVALLLLKGLSLEEIAQVRDTKEKTVRQQASSCYRKANVSGRHELAAFFFEDLLI